jgi:hypothetical protein
MTKAEVREALYKELAPLFRGFRLKKSEEGFVRAIPGGTQKVLVPLFDYKPVFIFSLMLCTRMDEVERIFNLFSGSPPKYQAMTLTSMTPLEFFYPDCQGKKEYKVETAEDVRNAVQDLSAISGKINLFLDQYQDVKSLDAAMNSGDGPRFDRSSDPYRAMHVLTLARLAKNPEFERLVAGYQAQAHNWNAVDKKKLDDLVSYLKQQLNS